MQKECEYCRHEGGNFLKEGTHCCICITNFDGTDRDTLTGFEPKDEFRDDFEKEEVISLRKQLEMAEKRMSVQEELIEKMRVLLDEIDRG